VTRAPVGGLRAGPQRGLPTSRVGSPPAGRCRSRS
jgi:hypothetical protein